jgi:3-O-methylgallate 3,4-dioxygenase
LPTRHGQGEIAPADDCLVTLAKPPDHPGEHIMARIVAGYGSSHSPMLASLVEDWQGGAFTSRDRARAHYDLDGQPTRYEDLLANAPSDAADRIAPALLARRHADVQAAIAHLRDDIASAQLDALIVVGDDQEELFDRSNMPAIGIWYGETIRNAKAEASHDPLGRARQRYQEPDADRDYPCHAGLARHLIAALQDDGFDLSVMRDTPNGRAEGHAFSYVHRFCMAADPVPIVPLFLNAYYAPNQPSPARCLALGAALARAVAASSLDLRVGILASGGLSHFLVDEDFDRTLMAALQRKDTAFFRDAPLHKLLAGSSEIRNWICLAGALGDLEPAWMSYVPGYRTPALTGTGLAFASFR